MANPISALVGGFIAPIKPYLWAAAILACLAGGVAVGRYVYDKGFDAAQTIADKAKAEAVSEAIRELNNNLADARRRDAITITTLKTQTANAERVQGALQSHLALQAATPQEGVDALNPPLLAHCVLDDATVRMLNDARDPARSEDGGGAAVGVDEEVVTPAAPEASAVGDGSQRPGIGH